MKYRDKTKVPSSIIEKWYQHRDNLKLQTRKANRKQIEIALLRSEEKFSKVFHNNPDIIIICTLAEGRFIEANSAFVEMSGYKQDESIGRTVQELGIWVNSENREYMLGQLQEKGHIQDFEAKLRNKFGYVRSFCISAEVINIDSEEHIVSNIRDITESKHMEEALRLSEECFSKAFNASPIPMTFSTIEEGVILSSNDAFNNMYGSTREEIIGQTSLEIFWLNEAERNLVIQRIIEKSSIRDMEINFQSKTGEKRLGLLSAELITIMGTPRILSIFTDITDLRKMEVEIARLDRLNLVGEMAASIGHEIRNPMTTVRGYLQILRENEDYRREAEHFDLMIEELDRANSIITEFLSLAKNKMVKLQTEDLNLIIMRLFPLLQAKAIEQDQNIRLELNDVPDMLLDKEEIHQLIFNLVDNGLESMSSAGGHVTIRTFVEKENVILAVQDQGLGIDRNLLDKLGIPFFTTKQQGTGLGLAVCYRIATRHNAKIDIQTSSTGTTCYVRFLIPTDATFTAAVNVNL